MAPIMVSSPTARTIAVALPEITFVPMNAKDSASSRLSTF